MSGPPVPRNRRRIKHSSKRCVRACRSCSRRPPPPARRAVLARLLPELLEPDKRGVELPEQSPERETARVFDALAHAVRSLAYPRPLLSCSKTCSGQVLPASTRWRAVVRESARVPILIVATCREEETPPDHPLRALVRSLGLFQNVEEQVLEPLTHRRRSRARYARRRPARARATKWPASSSRTAKETRSF